MIGRPYPWHTQAWASLVQRRQQGRLPHALLLFAAAGSGKQAFGKLLARSLLCRQPDHDLLPCGRCPACRQVVGESHPDLRWFGPEEESTQIRINTVRALIDWLNLTREGEGHRIAVVQPADAMNYHAANSLLKTLEEPPEGGLLLLLSDRPHQLPATLRSRCQKVDLAARDTAATHDWLADQGVEQPETLLTLSAQRPLHALEWASAEQMQRRNETVNELAALIERREEPLSIAKRWQGSDLATRLTWSHLMLTDLARLQLSARPSRLAHNDRIDQLRPLASQLDTARLHALIHLFEQARPRLTTTLNPLLLCEALLSQIVSSSAGAVSAHPTR